MRPFRESVCLAVLLALDSHVIVAPSCRPYADSDGRCYSASRIRHPPQPRPGETVNLGYRVQVFVGIVLYDEVSGRGVSGFQCMLFIEYAQGTPHHIPTSWLETNTVLISFFDQSEFGLDMWCRCTPGLIASARGRFLAIVAAMQSTRPPGPSRSSSRGSPSQVNRSSCHLCVCND